MRRGEVPRQGDWGFPRNVFDRRRYDGVSAIPLMLSARQAPWG
jgi:hypothetical protein